MARPTLRILTWVSGVLLGVMVLLLAGGVFLDPWQHPVTLAKDIQFGVRMGELDVRLVFFNDKNRAPYNPWVMPVSGTIYDREVAFGDTAGVYYRHFRLGPAVWWRLSVSIWYPIALFAILPGWRGVQWTRQRARRRKAGQCIKCGYDLRASPDHCPECGQVNAQRNGL